MKKNLFKTTVLGLAALTAVTGLAGCGKGGNVGSENDTKIKWYIFDNPSNTNAKDVYKAAGDMIKEKVGADMEFIPLESGNYESKMQILNATAEQLDIMFVSNWANNYYMNVSKKTLVPLDDMLKNVTPDLYNTIPEYLWEGSKVNGQIYAVPNQQIAAREARFAIPKQNVDILGINVDEYMSKGGDYKTCLASADEYLHKLYEKTGTYAKLDEIWEDGLSMFGMEEVLGSYLPGAIRYQDGELKVFNQYESEEFKYYINTRRKWVQDGLVQPEVDDTRVLPGLTDESVAIPALVRVNTYKPGVETDLLNNHKFMPEFFVKSKGYLTSGGVVATMNGISSTSKNPELALKVLEYVNTDKDIYNLLSYGIEDVNYKKTGENRIEKLDGQAKYSMAEWAVGNVFNSYLLPEQADDTWERTKEINDNADRSPLLGFNPNMDPLRTEIAACTSAIDEFLKVLDYGVVDVDTTYNEFIEKLKAAGSEKIVTEIQSQIDAWVAENK